MLRSVALVLSICACGAAPAPASPAPAPAVAPVTAAAEPPAPAVRAAEVAAEDGPIGVEACDHYVDTYRRCIETTLPEAERAVHAEAERGQRVAWARAKADPALAAELPQACAAARTAARVALPQCRGW